MNRTVLAIRHVHFEDLGTLEPLLRERGYAVRYVDAAINDLASLDVLSPDLVVVLGGPIGAFDDACYPFIANEVELIRQRLGSQRAMLGICLGAQLIARALGARVAPMGIKEIGFGALTLTPEGHSSPLTALDGVPVLHWHGDQFDIPNGALHLARTPTCAHQAFSMGNAVLGLQFHLEADPAALEQWLVGHACELGQAQIDPRELREKAQAHGVALRRAARDVMSRWLDGVEQTGVRTG
ncbi:glutamine amidotransferase [Herbaspirillum camelliae]|uniref:glutamine amidotransferase n=1 Tax=Herbaspirillum camelliae TaxID=1892903 RepID=UPI000949D2B0|nr:glutamine amidotransferase [Herbaspirillum camelliae]